VAITIEAGYRYESKMVEDESKWMRVVLAIDIICDIEPRQSSTRIVSFISERLLCHSVVLFADACVLKLAVVVEY